jgi:hypothetical protein
MNQNTFAPDDPHQQTRSLLAWYINGTLDLHEEAALETHLAQCPACRADLADERAMMAALPAPAPVLDAEAGWAAMRRRMEAGPAVSEPEARDEAPASNVVPLSPRPFWRRPVPMGWALGAQAAGLALAVGVGMWAGGAGNPARPTMYHALSSPTPASGANMLVMFRPDLPESDLRGILLARHAQITAGPNLGGAYSLRVAPRAVQSTLSLLRGDPRITLAEPIDESSK